MDRAVYACCAFEDCDGLERGLELIRVDFIRINERGNRETMVHLNLKLSVQLVVEFWIVCATKAVREEQEEQTAEEEGDEVHALEGVLPVGGSWRGSHVLGNLVDCTGYQ